jgi:cyclopropane fatty-acyl-phospholipid synthase-like methyltransferase
MAVKQNEGLALDALTFLNRATGPERCVLPRPLRAAPAEPLALRAAPRHSGVVPAAREDGALVFHDAELERRFGAAPIPVCTLCEAYFDQRLDISGDLGAFLRRSAERVTHGISRQHLSWAVEGLAQARREAAGGAGLMRELYVDGASTFYRSFLGDGVAHSVLHLESPAESLSDSEAARLARTLRLGEGTRLLDLGCGWATWLGRAVREHGAFATGVTLSEKRASFARRRFRALGVEERARVLRGDLRELEPGQFDRVCCLNLTESVAEKDLPTLLRELRDRTAGDGLALLRWVGLPPAPSLEGLTWSLFFAQHVSPRADAMPSVSVMLGALERAGWHVESVEDQSVRYAGALRRWRANWEGDRRRVVVRHGERAYRVWRMFFAWSELVMRAGHAACYEVLSSRRG